MLRDRELFIRASAILGFPEGALNRLLFACESRCGSQSTETIKDERRTSLPCSTEWALQFFHRCATLVLIVSKYRDQWRLP